MSLGRVPLGKLIDEVNRLLRRELYPKFHADLIQAIRLVKKRLFGLCAYCRAFDTSHHLIHWLRNSI